MEENLDEFDYMIINVEYLLNGSLKNKWFPTKAEVARVEDKNGLNNLFFYLYKDTNEKYWLQVKFNINNSAKTINIASFN